MAYGKYNTINVTKEEQITTIVLSRPEKLNALSPEMIDELDSVIPLIEKDKDTRAVVITGSGKAFSAGGDIELDLIPVSKMNPMQWREYIKQFCMVVKGIYYMEKPVIAAINGVTVGGGCDIAMACDIRIASKKARFGYGYIKMGIISDMGGHFFLPRLVGRGKAKLFAFTGDLIDAMEAERIGLVDKLVSEDDFNKEVKKVVEKIACGPTAAITLIKDAMEKSRSVNLDASLDYAVNLQSALLDSEDFREGYTAFLEKRKPVFKGR